MTTTLQHKPLPVVKMPKARRLTRFLVGIGVVVNGEPKREDIKRAHRIFRGAKGQSVEVNNLWNRIKRHVCRICDGIKLREKSDTCSHHCAMKARTNQLLISIALVVGVDCFAQRGTGANPTQDSGLKTQASFSSLIIPPLKQPMFTWSNPAGASNVTVSWGLMRYSWTNGTANIGTSNSFNCTNGWQYLVTVRVNDRESTPALWPSNRYDRVWIQTSTNLVNWTDAYIWTTNYNKPQEYLRHRSELIEWK